MMTGMTAAVSAPTPVAFRFSTHNRACQIRGAGFRSGATPPPRVRADARASGATATSSGARVTATLASRRAPGPGLRARLGNIYIDSFP